MENCQTILSKRAFASKILLIALQFVSFLAIAIVAPLLNQQIVSGSIVNATLFISAVTLGTPAAIMIGMVPSIYALSGGLLPMVLAPMIPFIIVGNTLLILIFSWLYKKNNILAMVSAGTIKFTFLFATSTVVINLLLEKAVASQVALMMSWPQLLTALIGGVIALAFLRLINKGGNK